MPITVMNITLRFFLSCTIALSLFYSISTKIKCYHHTIFSLHMPTSYYQVVSKHVGEHVLETDVTSSSSCERKLIVVELCIVTLLSWCLALADELYDHDWYSKVSKLIPPYNRHQTCRSCLDRTYKKNEFQSFLTMLIAF